MNAGDFTTVWARRQLVAKCAIKYELDPALVCAVCHHESGWNAYAIRYEPGFYLRYIRALLDAGVVKTATEATSRAMSWGLMQIMGQTAREHGYTGQYLSGLCDPVVGVEYGCRKLQRCMTQRPGDIRGALLSYNGGSDLKYPDLVIQYIPTYQDGAPHVADQ